MKNKYSRFLGSRLTWIVKVLLTVLFVIFVNRSLNLEQCRLVIGGMNVYYLAPVCFFWLFSFYFQITRWKFILRYGGLSGEPCTALRTFLFGSFLAFITPGRAGELFRGINIQKDKKGDSVIAALIDKFFHTAAIILTGAVFVVIEIMVLSKDVNVTFSIMLLSAISAAAIFFTLCFALYKTKINKNRPAKIIGYIAKIISGNGQRGIYIITSLSMLSHICLVLQTVFLFVMFGYSDFLKSLMVSGQAYAFISFLPFFIGNMGIREYAFNTFMLRYSDAALLTGFEGSIALTVSTTILILNYIVPACAGLIVYFLSSKEFSKGPRDDK